MKKVGNFTCECGNQYGIYQENGSYTAKKNDKPEEVKIPKKAVDKIEALRRAGVDVSNYQALVGSGNDMGLILREVNGIMEQVNDDDPVFAILKEGKIYDPRIAPRWVMSQMFHMLHSLVNEKHWRYRHNRTIINCIHEHVCGYNGALKFMAEEAERQASIFKHGDYKVFNDRNLFWNKKVMVEVCSDYVAEMKTYINELKSKKCKGMPYKRIPGYKDVFCSQLQKVIFDPIEKSFEDLKNSRDPFGLEIAMKNFKKNAINLPYEISLSKRFIDSYKGFGALATMQNLINYHGCLIADDRGCKLNINASLSILNESAIQYSRIDAWGKPQGWRMYGMMKKLIIDNQNVLEQSILPWVKRIAEKADKI